MTTEISGGDTDGSLVWTIVVAGGSGTRFGGTVPKQFVEIAGRRSIDWSIEAAAAVSEGVVVVVPAALRSAVDPQAKVRAEVRVVAGGDSRSASVRAGLAEVPDRAAVILVHDAARPAASPTLFADVVAAIRQGEQAVTPVVSLVDTVRHREGLPTDRDKLQAVQTPQGFAADALRRAHENGAVATDDVTLVELSGANVHCIAGERWNIKLTVPDDQVVLEALLMARTP